MLQSSKCLLVLSNCRIFPYCGTEVFSLALFLSQCFLNAIVQCLSHTQGLRDYCLTKTYLQDMCSSQEPELMNGGSIVPYANSLCKFDFQCLHTSMGQFGKNHCVITTKANITAFQKCYVAKAVQVLNCLVCQEN